MATTYEINTALSTQAKEVLMQYFRLDNIFKFDLIEPVCPFTGAMVLAALSRKQMLVESIRQYEDGQLSGSVLNIATRVAIKFLEHWDHAFLEGLLDFKEASDEEDVVRINRSSTTLGEHEADFVKDLTTEGVEPNPGPTRLSKHAQQLESEWWDQGGQFVHVYDDVVIENRHKKRLDLEREKRVSGKCKKKQQKSKAQIGGEYVDVRDPEPVRCERCGLVKCECMIKRVTVAASAVSIISSIMKIVESLMGMNKAQVFGWMFPSGASRLIDRANETLDSMPDASTISNAIRDAVNGILDSQCGALPISIKTLLKIATTVVTIYLLYRLGLLIEEVCVWILSLLFPEDAKFFVRPLREMFSIDKAQVGAITDFEPATLANMVPSMLALVFSGMTAWSMDKIPSRDNTITGWMQRMSLLPRTCKSMAEVFNYTKECLTKAWHVFSVKVLGFDDVILDGLVPQIRDWMALVEVYAYQSNLSELLKTREGRFKATHLYHYGDQLLTTYSAALAPEHRAAIQRALRQAAQIKSYVEENFPEMRNIRSVPTTLWMVGQSQIGKSRLQYLIHAHVCMALGVTDPEEIKRHMYMRNEDQEFWDGYWGQITTVIDDAFQVKDTSSNPSSLPMGLIQAINPFPNALHMAALSLKASTFFVSKFVMLSSNLKTINIESITHEDAVWNRLKNQSWEVVLKPEFRNEDGTLNIPKARADRPGWEINPYVYIFKKFDPRLRRNAIGGDMGINMEWDEFISQLLDECKEAIDGGNKLDDWLTKYISDHVGVAQVGKFNIVEGQQAASPFPIETTGTVREARDRRGAQAWREYVAKGIPETTVPLRFREGGHTLGSLADWLAECPQDPINNPPQPEFFDTLWRSVYAEMMNCAYDRIDYDKTPIEGFKPVIVAPELWHQVVMAYYMHVAAQEDTFWSRWQRGVDGAQQRLRAMSPKIAALLDFSQTYVKPFMMKAWDYTDFFLRNVGPFIPVALVFSYLENYIRTNYGPKASDTVAESNPVSNQPKLLTRVKATSRVRPTRVRSNAEMGQSLGQLDTIECVRKQQYLLSAVYEEQDGLKERVLGCVTNLKGTIMMMPHHFYTFLNAYAPKYLTMRHVDSAKIVIKRDFVGFFDDVITLTNDGDNETTTDVVLFSIKNFMRGRDIVRHFATDEDLAKLHNRSVYGSLSGLDKNGDEVVSTTISGPVRVLPENVHEYVLEKPGESGLSPSKVVATSIASYNIPTKSGDCGKLLSVNCDNVSGRIIGFHVSGNKFGSNYSQLISREILEESLAMFDDVAQIGRETPSVVDGGTPIDAGFIHIGKLEDNVPLASKTALRRSKLYGVITEPISAPALLRPKEIDGVLHDPLIEGCKKAGSPCGMIPRDLLDIAQQDVYITIAPAHREMSPEIRVLTYEESIMGVPGDDRFQPINRTTSPGYPYVMDKRPLGKKGKTNWMGRDEYDFTSEEAVSLRADVDELEHRCKNNIPFEILWMDVCKDERRSKEKVAKGATRIISNGPMHYNILFRKYFMAALAHIRHNRIYNGVAVGINVWSPEWNFLAKYMSAHSPYMVDGDFASFDGTISDEIMWSIFDILDRLYADEHTTIRRNLWQHAAYAMRCCRGTVYQCTHSLPSGFVATAEANSLYVQIMFRIVYMDMARRRGLPWSMSEYHRDVRVVAYGDDNIVSINPQAITWFNMESIIAGMARFGMTYTPADKTINVVPHKTIEEITFLKRWFKRVDGVCGKTLVAMCPANLESRLEMLNWTRAKNPDSGPEEAEVITEVLKELTMHGKSVYDAYAPRIVQAAIARGISGFRDEGVGYYHNIVSMGNCVPRSRDLAPPIQIAGVKQKGSIATSESGVSFNSYTLGSPGAALHQPRERQCGIVVKWPNAKGCTC